MNKKDVVILTAAIIVPGGLVVLGLWKAYELLKKKPKTEEDKVKKDE